MDDQLKVLEQGPLFLANVLGLRWLRPGSLRGLRGLGRRFGPGFQGWPVRSRFWGGGGRGTVFGALSGSSTTCTTWTPSHTLVGAQLLGPSPRRSSWLPLSSQRRAATERAVVSDCPEFASPFQKRQRLWILGGVCPSRVVGPAATAAPVGGLPVPATIAASVLPGPLPVLLPASLAIP